MFASLTRAVFPNSNDRALRAYHAALRPVWVAGTSRSDQKIR